MRRSARAAELWREPANYSHLPAIVRVSAAACEPFMGTRTADEILEPIKRHRERISLTAHQLAVGGPLAPRDTFLNVCRCMKVSVSRTPSIERTVAEVLGAGVLPLVLGGDHSIVEPEIRASAAVHGPVGVIHFDAHTDTGDECSGVSLSHGTPFYTLLEEGVGRRSPVRPDRAARLLAGRRGVRLAAAPRRQLDLRARSDRARDRRGCRAGAGDRRRRADVLDRRRRCARSGVRARHRHARARWDERASCCGPVASLRRAARWSARTSSRCSRTRSARPTSPP